MKKTMKTKSRESSGIDELRGRIDRLDERMVGLLNERTRIVLEIGALKKKAGEEIYVPAREKAVLDRIARLNKGPLTAMAVQSVYREIMSAALAVEHDIKVAYLGPEATFTHQAARQRFGGSVEYVPCDTITDVFNSVQKRTADYGVVPIENSIDGAVTHTLDELVGTTLQICAEIYLPIAQHLMARDAAGKVRRIYSKAEVFSQCRSWLHDHMRGVELVPASSTAKAAEIAARENGAAALASALAAELYGLRLLASDVQDESDNTTRFLVIGKRCGGPTGRDKTSVYLSLKDRVGALHDALSAFKKYRINMTKIESRPSKEKAWEYYFFVDIDGHQEDAPVRKALKAMSRHCARLTILGSYPRNAESAA
jgi:chorismate mutase/prephenate dehydratase